MQLKGHYYYYTTTTLAANTTTGKIQTGGVEDMEFLGVLKKKHVEIPGVN